MNPYIELQVFIKNTTFTIKKFFRRHKNMTFQKKIENSEVYRFFARNHNHFKGTGLNAMQLVEALAHSKISTKKSKYINLVCEYLKTKYDILCDDEQLRKLVTKAYEKVTYYEKRVEIYDFSNLSPIWKLWYQRLFQKRINGDFDF